MNHSCSSYARGQCIDVEDGGSTFCFRVMESVCVVFVTIVGSQVEVVDFNLLGKNVETEPSLNLFRRRFGVRCEVEVHFHVNTIDVEVKGLVFID